MDTNATKTSGIPPPELYRQDETDENGSKNIWCLWWGEIISLLTSVAALATMVALLWIYQDQPTSKWNSRISLNGVIAILSVVFKVSLGITLTAGLSHLKWSWFLDKERPLSDIEDFDKASRDPWGCFQFIFNQLRAKDRPVLGLLGALGLLLVVATEPFAQATVEYYHCSQLSSIRTASIPTANFFDPAAKTWSGISSTGMLDMASQLAIQRGLVNPLPNSSLSINRDDIACVSGNCFFPHDSNGATFTTLAICSRCTDITARLNRSKNGDDILFSLPSGAQTRVRTSPEPVVAMHIVDLAVDSPPLESDYWPFYTMEAAILREIDCHKERYTNPLCKSYAATWDNPSAASCSLVPCVKTYNAKIEHGVYSENELSARYLERVQVYNYSGPYLYRLVADAILQDGFWSPCNRTTKHETKDNNIEVYVSETPQCRENIDTT